MRQTSGGNAKGMSCTCTKQLVAMAAALRKLPMGMLAKLLNDTLGPLQGVATMAPNVCASLSASAMASAQASASAVASASAHAALSASAMARLEAMAAVNRSLGLGAMTPAVAARMSVLIQSSNQQIPDVLAALNEFLAPISAALDQLHAAIASLQNIQAMTGLNMALPGVAFRLPSASLSASAMASARANASATAAASANASAALSANAALAMRIQAAAMGLGFPLPGKAMSLSAAVQLAAGLPPLHLPPSMLHAIGAKISALAAAALATGVNLLTPNGPMHLNNVLAIAQANLSATISGTATATATASANASAALNVAATAAAKLDAKAIISAAASMNLSALPDLHPLSMTMSLAANLKGLTGTSMLSSSPCGSCKFKF